MAAVDISPRNERRLYLAGAALIAAHAVDAAFVDLEPGASAAFHLPWALTMLALLAATAAAYRRLPRGVRFALNGRSTERASSGSPRTRWSAIASR